jgi:hypothetical protein
MMLLLGLSPAWVALAKGPPDKMSITGPGLQGVAEVTDTDLIGKLGMAEFENFGREVEAPGISQEQSYEITRYFRDNDGKTYHPFDHIRYYPLASGEPGYVFYIGIINGSGPYDGKWYRATLAGDNAMRRVLDSLGATPPGPNSAPATTGTPWQFALLPAVGAALAIVGWIVYRREVTKSKQQALSG